MLTSEDASVGTVEGGKRHEVINGEVCAGVHGLDSALTIPPTIRLSVLKFEGLFLLYNDAGPSSLK